MQERFAHQMSRPPSAEPGRSTPPSSSRMIAGYLADIELLLEEKRWEQALREAFDLPKIAVALGDPQMRVAVDHVQAWCSQWLQQDLDAQSAGNAESSRVAQLVCERADRSSLAEESVPALALRRLRLHRLQRTRRRGFKAGALAVLEPEAADALQICTTLVSATRRWYAQTACHDAIVQANLARLAVLR